MPTVRRHRQAGSRLNERVGQAKQFSSIKKLINRLFTIFDRPQIYDRQWQSVTWGNPGGSGLYVAVASTGVGNRVMTSSDGMNWTNRASAADLAWRAVCWGGGLFFAVASTGSGNRVMTSPDGLSWTIGQAADVGWRGCTWGNNTFVAVGDVNRVMTSSNGFNWTTRTVYNQTVNWNGVAYNAGVFVASGTAGSAERLMRSYDNGVTWTAFRAVNVNRWISVTYGEVFVSVSYTQSGFVVMTSSDAVTWTGRSSATEAWQSVCFGNGTYVAVANTGTGNRVMTSSSAGVAWTSQVSAADNQWSSVCYGEDGVFVAVSIDGVGNRVMTSADNGVTWTLQQTPADI